MAPIGRSMPLGAAALLVALCALSVDASVLNYKYFAPGTNVGCSATCSARQVLGETGALSLPLRTYSALANDTLYATKAANPNYACLARDVDGLYYYGFTGGAYTGACFFQDSKGVNKALSSNFTCVCYDYVAMLKLTGVKTLQGGTTLACDPNYFEVRPGSATTPRLCAHRTGNEFKFGSLQYSASTRSAQCFVYKADTTAVTVTTSASPTVNQLCSQVKGYRK